VRAAIDQQSQIDGHVTRRGSESTVGRAAFQPGVRDERMGRQRRTVVEEPPIGYCDPWSVTAGDRADRLRHPQRFQDLLPHNLAVRAAEQVLEDVAERLVTDVRVPETFARRRAYLGFPQRPGLVPPVERGIRAHHDPARVTEQVVKPDRLVRRADREPRQIARDGGL
jgi:hypothetical protein